MITNSQHVYRHGCVRVFRTVLNKIKILSINFSSQPNWERVGIHRFHIAGDQLIRCSAGERASRSSFKNNRTDQRMLMKEVDRAR